MVQASNPVFATTPLGEQILYEVNRKAFDRAGSSAVYQRVFKDNFGLEDYLNIVVGTDSGLLPLWVAQQGLAQGSRYLFIELPGVVDTVRERIAHVLDDDRLAVCTIDEWPDYIGPFHVNEYIYIRQVQHHQSVGASDGYLPEYQVVRQRLLKEYISHQHKVHLQLGNGAFIQRQLENVADNLWPVQRLKDAFRGVTAAVLGGGPSLDELLPWIEENKDSLLVIAVSRVSLQLLARGIQPDIVVSVDPNDISFDVSKDMLRLPKDTLFVNAYHVSPMLLGQWHGTAAYNGERFPWETPANGPNMQAVGPTVTNNAMELALHLGCNRVIFAGVDLCYSREGYTHASGSSERQAGPEIGDTRNQVRTNDGGHAYSNPNLTIAIDIMGQQAAHARQLGCQVINPAPNAARIPNVDYLPAAEISLSPRPAGTWDIVQANIRAEDQDARRKGLQEAAKELGRANGRLRSILRLTDEALELNARLHDHDRDFKHKKRMDRIERDLDKEFGDLTTVVKSYATGAFLRLSRPDSKRAWSDEELENWGRSYYQIYKDGTQALLDDVEAAQQRVRSRLDELSDRPDLDALIAQWDRDRTPGRAEQLLASPLARTLDPQALRQLNACMDRFQQVLDEQQTQHARMLQASGKERLARARPNLRLFFDQRDTKAMRQLLKVFEHIDEADAKELHALAQGYLAELDSDGATALGHYHAVVDQALERQQQDPAAEYSAQLEDALQRISVIALNQGDAATAIGALEALSGLSPTYAPQFADLLRLTGRVQDAAAVYARYLDDFPDDLATMLKLGQLFQEAGDPDAARWAYDYVLDKDAENPAANHLRQSLNG